jgi:hypothetical protein
MNSKTYVKLLLASFLLGIGISIVGCGSSGNGSGAAAPQTAQAVANGYTPNNCFGPGTFLTAALDGTQVCQQTSEFSMGTPGTDFSPSGGILSPSSPATYAAVPMPMTVQPNDKLTMLSVRGSLGRLTESGGWIKHVSCDKYLNVDGKKNGVEIDNEGVPSGLFLSNGRATYPAFGPGTLYFNEAGPLRYGFNVPASERYCHSVRMRFKLDRCLDVASLPHKCK